MSAQTLRETLSTIAAEAVPDSTNLWPGISREIADRRQSPVRRPMGLHLPGLRRPAWALATAAAALGLVAVVLAPAILPGRLTSAEAAELARNDPQVAAYLRGDIVNVEVTTIVSDVATVVVHDATGQQVTVAVDLRSRIATVTYHGPQLSDALTRAALDVVRADPRTADLLARGATLGRLMPILVEMSGVDPVTGQTFVDTQTWAQVPLTLDGGEWMAYVDLPLARISQLIDPQGGQVPLP